MLSNLGAQRHRSSLSAQRQVLLEGRELRIPAWELCFFDIESYTMAPRLCTVSRSSLVIDEVMALMTLRLSPPKRLRARDGRR